MRQRIQINSLRALFKSLIKSIEDQNVIHQNQIEVLTKIVTQQIETMKAEVADIAAKTEQIQTQFPSIQTPALPSEGG